jgi:hypothetical protein
MWTAERPARRVSRHHAFRLTAPQWRAMFYGKPLLKWGSLPVAQSSKSRDDSSL